MIRLRHIVSLAMAVLVPVLANAQGTTGTITGTAREEGSGRPIPNARVTVVGTSISVPTRDDGTFVIRGAPTGTQDIRVLALGHAAQKLSVNVPADGTASVDFSLAATAIQLEQVVTTATGEQRKVEVGNDIPRINAAQTVETRPVANITDLLNARAPGVAVLGGAMVGSGQRIRIRGVNSLSLSNDPIVIIDGIRMTSTTGSSTIGTGGSNPSRLNDIDPNQIESIEVVKGPSASTLYGTDAANGVIVITTKRGRVGSAKWNAYLQRGRYTDHNSYPTAYTIFGHTPTGVGAVRRTDAANCSLIEVSRGTCIRDSVLSLNIFNEPDLTPLTPSYEEEYGLDASGGSETLRYFLQGSYSGDQGVYKVPKFEIDRLLTQNGFIPGEQLRPNALTRATLRGIMNLQLSPLADVAVSTVYISSAQRQPQTENNTTGLTSSAYRGPGYRENGFISGTTFFRNGYRAFTPGDIFQETVSQDINRFIGSVNPNWRPLTWLTTRGNIGVDFTNRVDTDLCRQGQCSDFGSSRQGFKVDSRANVFQYTVDVSGTAQFHVRESITSKTTVGAQYFRSNFHRNVAEGDNLPPGGTTVTGGAVPFASEATTYVVNAGSFIEETFSFRDRLFLTGALRADNNSAFGTKASNVTYPKASLSWVLSDEPFFPKPGFLSSLRLRTAYGQSGTSPGTNDAIPFFAAAQANIADAATAAVIFSAVGNPNLKPERASELEGGLDIDMFDNRASVTLTGYKKKTRDALVSRVLPPSAGVSSTRFENLGAVQNSGFEASLRAQVVQTRMIGIDGQLNYSTNNNKLLKLGGVPPVILTSTGDLRHMEGYPLFGAWPKRILSYSDLNGDGILTGNEVVVSDSNLFLGRSSPKVDLGFTPGVDLFNRMLRLTANIDHRGGFFILNDNERIRCGTNINCSGSSNPDAPLYLQARVAALRDHPSRTDGGFWEKGDYTKLREVALTFTAPENWVGSRVLRTNRFSVTMAGRNLKTWTQFTGIDPEAAAQPGGQGVNAEVTNVFQSVPPPRLYTIRFNLGF
ncbi:MAG TPA: SusC/RagA family TonB-linked outer membrane protein [Gemmatimonadaceae bacterium]|nr:SusC/RagA family TonB-linked outer membrane protein [Gemmatimonadaceae bacterium]